jgi:4Fe-4S dicluster protein
MAAATASRPARTGLSTSAKEDGRAWKCTLCYDRLSVGQEPACAKNCPTNSIQFGPLDELRERADARLVRLHEAGVADARLYGRDPHDGVGGDGAFFLLDVETRRGRRGDAGRWGAGGVRGGKAAVMSEQHVTKSSWT